MCPVAHESWKHALIGKIIDLCLERSSNGSLVTQRQLEGTPCHHSRSVPVLVFDVSFGLKPVAADGLWPVFRCLTYFERPRLNPEIMNPGAGGPKSLNEGCA